MNRKINTEYSITEPIKLEDLRWLVAQCEALPGSNIVIIKGAEHFNQFDNTPSSITVLG